MVFKIAKVFRLVNSKFAASKHGTHASTGTSSDGTFTKILGSRDYFVVTKRQPCLGRLITSKVVAVGVFGGLAPPIFTVLLMGFYLPFDVVSSFRVGLTPLFALRSGLLVIPNGHQTDDFFPVAFAHLSQT